MLADRGATVIDADVLAREAVDPDTQAFRDIAKRWGTDVLNEDGSLDREALRRIVFADSLELEGAYQSLATASSDLVEGMAAFREIHYKWAQEYINRWVEDPRGTGGTPYMTWLKQLIDETRDHKRS